MGAESDGGNERRMNNNLETKKTRTNSKDTSDASMNSHDFFQLMETYFSGKKIPAGHLWVEMRKTQGIREPSLLDSRSLGRLVEVCLAKKDGIDRLLELLRTDAAGETSVQGFLAVFLQAVIRALNFLPNAEDAETLKKTIIRWVGSFNGKPLKQTELKRLFLILHAGRLKGWIDHEFSRETLRIATIKQKKSTGTGGGSRTENALLDILLSLPSQPDHIASLLIYSDALGKKNESSEKKLRESESMLLRMRMLNDEREGDIAKTRRDLDEARKKTEDLEKENLRLKEQLEETREGYQFKLDDLRGKVAGMLEDELSRWVQTAYDASSAEPPRLGVVRERLEDILKLVGKGKKWLRPSE